MYQVPAKKLKEIKAKYDKYMDRLRKYERNAMKLDLKVKGDDAGLLAMKHEEEAKKDKSYGQGVLNEETMLLTNGAK